VRSISFQLSVLSLALCAAACSATQGSPTGSGGASGQGGQISSGGTLGTGGVSSGGGGAPATGGSVGTGGVEATGGITGDGGTTPRGGGGAAGGGGSLATGGVSASGGVTSTGGSTVRPTGGNAGVPTGGSATGGTTSSPTGGTTGGGTGGTTGGGTGGTTGGGTRGTTGGGTGGTTGGGTGGTTGTGGGTTNPNPGCTPPTTYPNLFVTISGHTQAESDDKVSKAWSSLFNPSGSGTIYYNGPGSDESYVEDLYNHDVRTEGMSYGMMTAVQLDHQTEFDRLWTWVKKHMANGTGEISWSCSTSGSKNSSGGAPDGEEYFATALIFAHKRWGDAGKYNYATEAQWVLDLIRTRYFNSTYHLVQFVSNSGNVDGSYVLPAFYQVWACFDTKNAAFWNESVTAARDFFHKAADANGVIPDRSSFTGQAQGGAGADAIRCVMNIMMDWNFFAADPWQKDTYAVKFGAYSKNAGGTAQYPNATLGFALPEASGKPFVDKLWSASVPNHDYWNGVLYMLALLHVSGTFHLWY
jgi:oligosaccharide reducing-end xylanase